MMKPTRRSTAIAASLTLAAGLGVVAMAAPSQANTTTAPQCSVVQSGTTYTGNNRVVYASYSTTLWKLTRSEYNFGPTQSGSDQNNQNIYFNSGGGTYTENSTDTLVRDSAWHTGIPFASPAVYGRKGQSYMRFTDIFDTTSSDPNCVATTPTF